VTMGSRLLGDLSVASVFSGAFGSQARHPPGAAECVHPHGMTRRGVRDSTLRV
jgi:hypothetical protein